MGGAEGVESLAFRTTWLLRLVAWGDERRASSSRVRRRWMRGRGDRMDARREVEELATSLTGGAIEAILWVDDAAVVDQVRPAKSKESILQLMKFVQEETQPLSAAEFIYSN